MSNSAVIIGTGSYAPEKVLTNKYFDEYFGENVSEWLEENLNIKQRHICSDNESTADLATTAAERALKNADIKPEKVDLIILGTDTPEYISPASSAVVQYRLGAKNSANFDVNCACAAFVTGLDMGARYIMSDTVYQTIVVIGVYAMTKYVNWDDKYTCTIFADGAGAAVLKASKDKQGFVGGKLIADGQYHDYIGVYAGGTKYPISYELIDAKKHQLAFLKKYPPDINSKNWPILVRDVAKKCNFEINDIDFIFFTQININTIHEVMAELGLPVEKTHCIMDRYGYTGSACIALALDDAVQQGKLKSGDLVGFVGSGAGYNMACAFFKWV